MTGASSGNVGKTLYATIGKSHKSDDWQLPDIQMNTVGQNSSENRFYRAIWWTIGRRKQVGICLAFLGKLAFGTMNEEDDLCTDFQIHVTTMDQYHQNSLRTSRVECILESMLASIHVAILHAHDVSRSYFHGGSF